MLSWFLQKPDPSDTWDAYRPQPLVLDLRDFSLNGVKFGDPPANMIKFGRPSNKRPFKKECFEYLDAGFVAGFENDAIDNFMLVVVDVGEIGFGSCRFTLILPNRRQVNVDERTTWRELRDHLPKPSNVDRDAAETVYFITLGRCTLDVECSPEDRVQCLNLYVTPASREVQ